MCTTPRTSLPPVYHQSLATGADDAGAPAIILQTQHLGCQAQNKYDELVRRYARRGGYALPAGSEPRVHCTYHEAARQSGLGWQWQPSSPSCPMHKPCAKTPAGGATRDTHACTLAMASVQVLQARLSPFTPGRLSSLPSYFTPMLVVPFTFTHPPTTVV